MRKEALGESFTDHDRLRKEAMSESEWRRREMQRIRTMDDPSEQVKRFKQLINSDGLLNHRPVSCSCDLTHSVVPFGL